MNSRVVDPDPDWIRIQSGLWIQIRIRIRNPDPYSESGSVFGIRIWIRIQEGKNDPQK
jgi:hypothetical protein